MIIASFLTQYGLRIRTKEFETVSWDEFHSLLSGIAPETPLGRIVAIRAETDKKIIENFSHDQKRIHDDWQKRKAEKLEENPQMYEKEMENLERIFMNMCGGG